LPPYLKLKLGNTGLKSKIAIIIYNNLKNLSRVRRFSKLTQAIIKLQRELDRAYNKKRRLEWASELR
jgi:hypothetical protein